MSDRSIVWIPGRGSFDLDNDGQVVDLELGWFGTPQQFRRSVMENPKRRPCFLFAKLNGVMHRYSVMQVTKTGAVVARLRPTDQYVLTFDEWKRQHGSNVMKGGQS